MYSIWSLRVDLVRILPASTSASCYRERSFFNTEFDLLARIYRRMDFNILFHGFSADLINFRLFKSVVNWEIGLALIASGSSGIVKLISLDVLLVFDSVFIVI